MDEEQQEHKEITDTAFNDKSDLCQQLLNRYGKSSALQHRHLCATAAATRSIIQSEYLPLTPLSYFAATISAIAETAKTLDINAVSALSSFFAIVVPLVPGKAIASGKASEAVSVLVEMLESKTMGTASVRAVIKCLGVLIGFCELEDWDSVKLGFETLLKFSIDKRPKVRKCAQDCVVKVFKSFDSSTVIKEASKLVYSLLISHMPLAVEISASRALHGSRDESLSKPEQLEVLHMLNVLKLIVPFLSVKVSLKVIKDLQKLMSCQFSALTRHNFDIIEAMHAYSRPEVIIRQADTIINSLASYISLGMNPVDTVLSAANLLKVTFEKLYASEPSNCTRHFPLVFRSITGLLLSEASTASQASQILQELINCHIDRNLLIIENQPVDNVAVCNTETTAIISTCTIFDNVLSSCGGIPNEHILAVLSVLFLKLGDISSFYMKGILLKLSELLTIAVRNTSDTKHLQKCIGSAIIAMGPEKLLTLLPITFNDEDLSCSNIWLILILKNYVIGSSLGFFMDHIVPLAESLQQASHKDKKQVIGQDLRDHAHCCWELLPAFCRYPTDIYQNFGRLAKLLLPFLKKDSFMLQNVAIALQELVNQNRRVLLSNTAASDFANLPTSEVNIAFESKPSYSKKTASRNVRALVSCSEELLLALTDVLFDSPPEKRSFLKNAIGSLASITDSSVVRKIFISCLERFQLVDDLGECGKLVSHTNASVDEEQSSSISMGKDMKRCMILELASSIVEGASEDLSNLIFNFIRHALQEANEIVQRESYHTLSRIIEEHSSFCSSRFVELMDLLLNLKSPVDILSLRSRFTCFQTLLVHTIKRSSDDEIAKAFLILNEVILALKDSKEEGRKAAYDTLLKISSILQNSSCTTDDGPYHKLISMGPGMSGENGWMRTSGDPVTVPGLHYIKVVVAYLDEDPYSWGNGFRDMQKTERGWQLVGTMKQGDWRPREVRTLMALWKTVVRGWKDIAKYVVMIVGNGRWTRFWYATRHGYRYSGGRYPDRYDEVPRQVFHGGGFGA
ncbi:unnamed protein product [Ilex paraguariensis]|uniref:Ribosomal RNA-processing protein 12-like conserved domain-containing protein n=1 Tax=Ilex paraguariensis TaxID=185542 RepID=A0ABC8UMZ2_9AQUA